MINTGGVPGENGNSSNPRERQKYTYFLPVKVGPNGKLELPEGFIKQLKLQELDESFR